MSNVKLNTVVQQQLPEFIREDYPAFVAFVKAYFEYLELIDPRDISDLRDIDKTIYDYIITISNEIGFSNSPDATTANISPQLFLRKSKSMFISKGTEESYRFLFKILFNKIVDISYPWDSVLKTSDGKWRQDTSIFVEIESGDINTIIGNEISIYSSSGINTIINLSIDRIKYIDGNIYEIFINKNFYGTINIGDPVLFGDFHAKVIPTTSNYTIEVPGLGFKQGDLITASTLVGSTIVKQIIKVSKVNNEGGILAITNVSFGSGYNVDFLVPIIKPAPSPLNSNITNTKNSALVYSSKDTSNIEAYAETGSIINPNVISATYSDPFYAGQLVSQFYNETLNNIDITKAAYIRFHIGAIAKYQGYYISNDGFLDDAIKLQDNKYYQKYSYLLTVDERYNDYKIYLKSFIHSAGLALYGEYQIQNTYNPGITGKIYVDQYTDKAVFKTINKTITKEFVSVNGAGGRITINPYDLESYFENTYNPETYSTFTG